MIAQASPVATTPDPKPPRTIEELTRTVSASRLNLFHQCRLKFYFRYVLGLVKPKTPALHIGTTVHATLQAWNLARWRKTPWDMESLKGVFEAKWLEEQKDHKIEWEDEEGEEKQRSWTLLETYFQQTPIPSDEKPEGVEVSVEADLKKHGLPALVGIIDLVRQGGRIVDFKTSAQTPNAEKAVHLNETQLSCYAVLYRDATGQKEGGIELHHLVKLKTPKLVVTSAAPITQTQQSRLFRLIESYVRGVEAQDWVPNPNPMSCACCEYFNECRKWS